MDNNEFRQKLIKTAQEIEKQYTGDLLGLVTERDRSGRGYICPLCNSGKGDGKKHNGTGLSRGTKGDKTILTCWNCGFKGSVLDLIGKKENKSLYYQIRRAEELLHRDFLNIDNNYTGYKAETPKPAEKEIKNMVQNTDSKTLVEKVKAAEEKQKKAQEIRQFMETSRKKLPAADNALAYLKQRGISENTAYKYGLGYAEYYRDGMNTPAIIIPTGKASFAARSIEPVDGGRKYRKRNDGHKQGIFNIGVLQNPGAVCFVVEGEIDCLSIIEAGFNAMATGGGTSEEEIINVIKESKTRPVMFVILPDNDRNDDGTPDETKGYSKGLKMWNALKTAEIPVKMIDTRKWNPDIKDANDYLVADRSGFIALLRGIVEPITAAALRNLGRASDYVQSFIDHISGKTAPISTGFKTVDNLLDGGLHPGLIVVGAISSLGKTTFILNLADNIAAAGQDVIVFSLEMSKFELMAKSISRRTFEYCKANKRPMKYAKTNLGISDFDRYDRYDQEEQEIIYGCMDEYQRTAAEHIYVIEGVGNIGTDKIRKDVEDHFALTGNKPVVIVDYMQILAPASDHSTDKQNTDKNVVELKRISRDLNIPVIAISSFNRDNYTAPVSMAAFKESGCIEYTSDVLIGLQYHGMDYQPYTGEKGGQYFETEKDKHRLERIARLIETVQANSNSGEPNDIDIKVLKNRSGKRGAGVIRYYSMFNCYREE